MALPRDASSQMHAGFEGELAGLSLPDLLQLNARNRFSGCFRVDYEDQQGLIYFRDGEIVHAEHEGRLGEEAFRQILRWSTGRFRVQPDVITARRTINKTCEHLLLDALRALDERGLDSDDTAPAPAPARAPSPVSTLATVRAVADVADAVLLTRDGKRVGDAGYEAEVLAGQSAFLAMIGAELGDLFQVGEIRFASVQGSKHHLLLYSTKNHYLGVAARPSSVVGAVDAAIRGALTVPR